MKPTSTLPIALMLCLPSLALAQVNVTPIEPVLPPPPPPPAATPGGTTGAAPAGAQLPPPPPTPPDYQSQVRGRKPSPVWTQDRNFASTRVWLLDPGTYSFETWWYTRIYPSISGRQDPTSYRFFQEVAWGVAPHLQLDLYAEFHLDQQTDVATGVDNKSYYPSLEGLRAEARIAIPDAYGIMPTNPVIYLEYQAYLHDPSRFEIRLLLGGAATNWLYLAANPYFEFNITQSSKDFLDDKGVKNTKQVFLLDAELGATGALGFKLADWINLSLQAKVGVDMLGDENNRFHFVAWAGPGFHIKPLPAPFRDYLKIIGTLLILLPGSDTDGQDYADQCANPADPKAVRSRCYGRPQQFEPTLILGTHF